MTESAGPKASVDGHGAGCTRTGLDEERKRRKGEYAKMRAGTYLELGVLCGHGRKVRRAEARRIGEVLGRCTEPEDGGQKRRRTKVRALGA